MWGADGTANTGPLAQRLRFDAVTERPALSQRNAALAVVAATAFGLALRLPGLWTDFWLDEIWTWNLAMRLDSAETYLNTLLLYWLGEREHWVAYRSVAFVTGVACIPLSAAILWSRGRLEAALAAWLIAGCFALVHFSSEARGSGPTVAAALAALWLLERDRVHPRLATALGFGLCVVAGFLFQLVFCFFWAGAFAYSAHTLAAKSPQPRQWLSGLLRLHALPALAFAALWLVDLRQLTVGGGEPLDLAWLSARVVGYGFGLPTWPTLAWPASLLALALVFAGLGQLYVRRDPLWIVFGCTIVLAPALVIGWLRPDVLAVRYFLIGIAATLMLCASLAAAALRAGGWRRGVAIAALALFGIGNAAHTARFLEFGRGGYAAALAAMHADTPGARVQVGSDHDFRVGSVLKFYARQLPDPERLHYVNAADWPSRGPEWLILHRQELGAEPDAYLLARDATYRLIAVYDHAAISGYSWILYRNTAAAEGGASNDAPPKAATSRRRS